MPIRGPRPVFPTKGRPPTGIFSTKGKQKDDGNARFSDKDTLLYAYSSDTRSQPNGNSNQGKRHQPPRGKK